MENLDEEYIGQYGQIVDFYGFQYWDYLEEKLQWALDNSQDEFVVIQTELYDEGDEYPSLLISDILVPDNNGQLTNSTHTFRTPDDCTQAYKSEVCRGCNVLYKEFHTRDNLYDFIHYEYDGDASDGEYCITDNIDW